MRKRKLVSRVTPKTKRLGKRLRDLSGASVLSCSPSITRRVSGSLLSIRTGLRSTRRRLLIGQHEGSSLTPRRSPRISRLQAQAGGSPEQQSTSQRYGSILQVSKATPIVAARPLNQGIMRAGSDVEIDPNNCLSLSGLRVRRFSLSGLERLRHSIVGSSENTNIAAGYVATSKKAFVAEVPNDYIYLVKEHFERNGLSKKYSEEKANIRIWHHVVDGGHLHQVLVNLAEESPETFAGFKWLVTKIPWQPLQALRPIARMSHEMQQKLHFIQFTFSEVLFNLREISDGLSNAEGIALRKENPYGFIQRVVDNYSGGSNYSSSTLHNLAAIAVKISMETVSAMIEIFNKECPREAKAHAKQKSQKGTALLGHRIFRNLMTTQMFRGANLFLKSPKVTDEDRINVFYRVRFIAEASPYFKGAQKKNLEDQTKKALLAKRETEKFAEVSEKGEWPAEMLSFKHNLLRKTKLDDEVESNTGNEKMLLPSLEKMYIFHVGFPAKQRITQFKHHKETVAMNSSSQRVARGSKQPPPASIANDEITALDAETNGLPLPVNDGEIACPLTMEEPAPNLNEVPASIGIENNDANAREVGERHENSDCGIDLTISQPEPCPLHRAQVFLHQLGWEEYEIRVMTEQSIFDLVLDDPYQPNHTGTVPFMDENELL